MTTGFEIFCLCVLLLGLTMVVYFMVWLHGIPHHIAEANNHPHKHTIHHACWLSLFTLHAIWPLVYLWAIMPGKTLAVRVEGTGDAALLSRVAELERRLANQPTEMMAPVAAAPVAAAPVAAAPVAAAPVAAAPVAAASVSPKKDV